MYERQNYQFKLNVQPHILKKYVKNMEELKNEIIPNMIFNSYSDLFSSPVMSEVDLILDIELDYKQILESTDYQTLLKVTDELVLEYKQITNTFRKGGGIHYSPEYLSKLEKAIDTRKQVVSKFNVLNQAKFNFTTSQAYEAIERIYDFSINAEIGKGLDHIRKVRKFILYIDFEQQKELESISVRYSFINEIFTIENVTKFEALDTSRKIEQQVNDSKSSIGSIKINPIYDSVVLYTKETTRTIEIITSFPNGNTDTELDILLKLSENTNSKEVRTTLVASDDIVNDDFVAGTNKMIEIPAKQGYLSDVRSNGNTIINIYDSKIKIG
ncbi:hypothetical protein [Streptococcus pluranimalium]|uniref:hypothetical protein n=1 Tax=Streptococcus pluranimalium TaxID=82348 RepID=UPI003F68CA8E